METEQTTGIIVPAVGEPEFVPDPAKAVPKEQYDKLTEQQLAYHPRDLAGNLVAPQHGGEVITWVERDPDDPEQTGGELHLRCPHCGGDDCIQEQDRAIRWNQVYLDRTEAGAVFLRASLGDNYDFEQDGEVGFFCENCGSDQLELPHYIEMYD